MSSKGGDEPRLDGSLHLATVMSAKAERCPDNGTGKNLDRALAQIKATRLTERSDDCFILNSWNKWGLIATAAWMMGRRGRPDDRISLVEAGNAYAG